MNELPIVAMNERHFDNGDGTFTAEIYGQPIYFHKNGKIESVENFSLYKYAGEIKNGSAEFPVKVNGLRTRYVVDGETIDVTINGLYVDDTLLQLPNEVTPVYTDTEIFYEEIFDGVDIRLVVTPYKTQEFIIFKKNPLAGKPVDGVNISVKYDIDGYIKTLQPYAFDANRRDIAVFETEDSKGISVKALYTYNYPITLDPTVSPVPSADCFVTLNGESGGYQHDYTGNYLRVSGYTTEACSDIFQWYCRSYLRFDLSSLSGQTINSAGFYCVKPLGTGGVQLKAIASGSEIDPNVFANRATIYANVGSSANIGSSVTGSFSNFDVATQVNAHKGGYCDFGIINYSNTEENAFYSSEYATVADRPKLVIVYSGSGATTYTKTVTAKARIKTASVTKTVTAKARIKKLANEKTVTAKARITLVAITTYTKTVTAKARIKATQTKTVTAKAKIVAAALPAVIPVNGSGTLSKGATFTNPLFTRNVSRGFVGDVATVTIKLDSPGYTFPNFMLGCTDGLALSLNGTDYNAEGVELDMGTITYTGTLVYVKCVSVQVATVSLILPQDGVV